MCIPVQEQLLTIIDQAERYTWFDLIVGEAKTQKRRRDKSGKYSVLKKKRRGSEEYGATEMTEQI